MKKHCCVYYPKCNCPALLERLAACREELAVLKGIIAISGVNSVTSGADELRREREEAVAKARAALEEAVSLISAEYCSHGYPCRADLQTCYANKQIQALEFLGAAGSAEREGKP